MKSLFERCRARLFPVRKHPDFSAVTTPMQALTLHGLGTLKRTLLLPEALGGVDAETNAAYVPPAAFELLQRLNETLKRYMSEGRIDRLSVDPEYKGRSLVPRKIRVSARHSGRTGEFITVIGIW
jgi:hypothetical protein